jgi:hypothetical protein
MLIGKIDKCITMKIYDENGHFLGEAAKYDYKPVLIWRDVIIGLSMAILVFTQMI